MSVDDKRLIEDYLPIEKISAEASREKSVRKGHISTLHLWWARRPLVACRAAVYGALVPASRFVPNGASDEKKKSLGRANAAKFVERLCQYPGNPSVIAEARQHILEAHAERLSQEMGKRVTVEDIVGGRAPRPKVLDMFAGGGAIPLEAMRLGCEAYALELNPVAHIIELCTLVYPQKYGGSDPAAQGMTGAKNTKGETTWGGLAEEVRYWGARVLEQITNQIEELYPPIPDPDFQRENKRVQTDFLREPLSGGAAQGYLAPIAYLWTRAVTCKNPLCGASVPLVKQTWLSRKPNRYVALKIVALQGKKRVRFEVVEARSEKELGFDPAVGSKAGNATCPFCGTLADSNYVKAEGCGGRMTTQLMAVVATSNERRTRYLAGHTCEDFVPANSLIEQRIAQLCEKSQLVIPDAQILDDGKSSCWCRLYGLVRFSDLHLRRQLLCLLTISAAIKTLARAQIYPSDDHSKAVITYLALALDRVANYSTSICVWRPTRTCVLPTFSRQALPLAWDFGEMNPFCGSAGDWTESVNHIAAAIEGCADYVQSGEVIRGSATRSPWPSENFDAVVTDPPYYDNVFYANLADFFYIWLKQNIGDLYPEHFSSATTPKREEAVADSCRHDGNRTKALSFYEQIMERSFREANRVLKPGGCTCVIYAHKTTLGWATLIDALRKAGSQVTEAWPIDTEMAGGMRTDKASLASSIFLVARKRDGASTGNYEEVRPELEQIVQERVGTLWEMGISGADLVIACVGAGLRAFTQFAQIEYANGDEVPAERFLTEVETVVLDTILARLSKEVGTSSSKHSLAGLDAATRFYVLWRYTYKAADLDPGEAIIFANGTHVELDGAHGLSSGAMALVAKSKGKYRLLDFIARGDDAALGMPSENGQPAPQIDALHRILWLMERHPSSIAEFLRDARPNTEQLRLVAQALAGPALKGSELGEVATGTELAALTKLTANWRSVVEDVAEAAVGPLFRGPRETKQR